MSAFLILLALALWGAVHSFLASRLAKDLIGLPRFYRLLFNGFAVIAFAPIVYLLLTLDDQILYRASAPWNSLLRGGQGAATFLAALAFLQTDALSFVGLSQLFDANAALRLFTGGLYRLVRHPLYLFSILILWLNPTMSANWLAFSFGATLYFVVGAKLEERKLLQEFGADYADYQRRVPFLFPLIKIS
ncbi:MAG: isoprenylcysteine carboxylmethyltransferase family protein [Anaerolineales bacterium]|nr:isoprenylcysteine carboxylmethyltransferase family protein [Anaerolineales bacterium]